MKKINGHRGKYFIIVFFTGIIDVLMYVFILGCLVGMGYSLFKVIEGIVSGCFTNYNQHLTSLGVYASLSLIPVSSILISFVLACRTFVNEVENDLAKGSNIQVQIKKLPRGAGMNSARYLQEAQLSENQFCERKYQCKSNTRNKTLVDYKYEIDIFYKQELSEFFIISLLDVNIVNIVANNNGKEETYSLSLRKLENTLNSPCIVKDNAGVSAQREGEQIVVFLSEELKDKNNKTIEDYLYGKTQSGQRLIKRLLRIKMNFLKKNFSQKNLVIFPITRNLVEFFTKSSLKRRVIVAEIEFRLADEKNTLAIQTTTNSISTYNSSVKGLDIIDLSYKIYRDVSWVGYIDKKLKKIEKDIKIEKKNP